MTGSRPAFVVIVLSLLRGFGAQRKRSLIERPLALEFLNRAVVNIYVHVVFRSRNHVKAGASILGGAILFAGKLPEHIRFPDAAGKVSYISFETRVPQRRLIENVVCPELFGDLSGNFIVRVDERIAPGFFLNTFDEDPSFIEIHVLGRIRAIQVQCEEIIFSRFDCAEKEIGLLNRVAGLSEMVGAPFVSAPLRFNSPFGIFPVGA